MSAASGKLASGDVHWQLGHYGFMAALGLTILAVGVVASLRPAGWRISAWVAGLLPAGLGFLSLAYRDQESSLGVGWALLSIIWGMAFIAVAESPPPARTTLAALSRPPWPQAPEWPTDPVSEYGGKREPRHERMAKASRRARY